MDLSVSDSDFEEETGSRRRRSSSSTHSLRSAINRARRYIRKARTDRERQSGPSGFADELAARFPFHSHPGPLSRAASKSKKRKVQQWKLIPVCLQSPQTVCVPTKGVFRLAV